MRKRKRKKRRERNRERGREGAEKLRNYIIVGTVSYGQRLLIHAQNCLYVFVRVCASCKATRNIRARSHMPNTA